MSNEIRPERHAALELKALLGHLGGLRDEGDRERYFSDDRYRWLIHRLWIAAGNEAAELEAHFPGDKSWRDLRLHRNELAHNRLPDIDDDKFWRFTSLRIPGLLERVNSLPL